jgi:sarcosine oxidase delta subunit
MAGDGRTDVVDFDADAALAAVEEIVGSENVFTCVVYDDTEFRTVYVDDRVEALYDDRRQQGEHFEEIHSYVHLDFSERGLFEELFRDSEGVRAFVTYMGDLVAVRVVSDRQGIFFSIAPDAPVTKLLTAVEAEIDV